MIGTPVNFRVSLRGKNQRRNEVHFTVEVLALHWNDAAEKAMKKARDDGYRDVYINRIGRVA